MRCKPLTFTFLTTFLFLTLLSQAYATPSWHFPKSFNLAEGVTQHFGNDWIQSIESPIKVTKYFTSNWFNYTCTGGIQYIHNGTKPAYVYFDDVLQTEDDTWSYSGGTITLSPSGTDVGITWTSGNGGEEEEEEETGGSGPVWILLTWLSEGDFLGFFQALYITAFMSPDVFYGTIIMVFMGAIYIRTKSLALISILWILIGSGFMVAVPIAAGLGLLLIILGIGGMLFSLFKARTSSY